MTTLIAPDALPRGAVDPLRRPLLQLRFVQRQPRFAPVKVWQRLAHSGRQPHLRQRRQNCVALLDIGKEDQIATATEALHLRQQPLRVLADLVEIVHSIKAVKVAQTV